MYILAGDGREGIVSKENVFIDKTYDNISQKIMEALCIFFAQAAALVHIYLDGSVLVTHGGIEMGQGVHTKMIQVRTRRSLGEVGCA